MALFNLNDKYLKSYALFEEFNGSNPINFQVIAEFLATNGIVFETLKSDGGPFAARIMDAKNKDTLFEDLQGFDSEQEALNWVVDKGFGILENRL